MIKNYVVITGYESKRLRFEQALKVFTNGFEATGYAVCHFKDEIDEARKSGEKVANICDFCDLEGGTGNIWSYDVMEGNTKKVRFTSFIKILFVEEDETEKTAQN